MTQEEWKKKLPLIQAYVNGETIQYCNKDKGKDKEWCDIESPSFTAELYHYRVKPKEEYRPFQDGKECFNEMMNHHPFGWVRHKTRDAYIFITRVEDYNIWIGADDLNFSLKEVYLHCSFADGTPFGIKENI